MKQAGPKKRILLVDDEVPLMAYYVEALRHAGFQVSQADGPTEALEYLSGEEVDLVVMDIMMPPGRSFSEMETDSGLRTGVFLAEMVRKLNPNIPIAVLTNVASSDTLRALERNPSVRLVLQKFECAPFELSKRLEKVLSSAPPLSKPTVPLQPLPPEFCTPRSSADSLNEALAEVVGGFCHDLSSSLLSVQLGLDDPSMSSEQKVCHAAPILRRALEGLKDLHQFVRQYYRSSEQSLVHVCASDMSGAVREMAGSVSGPKDVILKVEVGAFEESFRLPRLLLRQVVMPLVANSFEAIDSRGVVPGDSRILISIQPLAPEVGFRIVVEDTGSGWKIPRKKIAEALRAGQRLSTKGRSRGIGLQNLYRIVRRLGGLVLLEDSPQGGASVEVRIPWKG